MAGEIQFNFAAGRTCYALVRNRFGQIYSAATLGFVAYNAADYADYAVTVPEQGTGYYIGNLPAVVAGVYCVTGKQQIGGAVSVNDPSVSAGDVQFNGSTLLPLSDLATSGQVGQFAPARIARGTAVPSFPVYLRSAADHVTPFTSGVVSGQISRDGGPFVALQSGAFTETGLGFYNVPLTSGDTLANSFSLVFTAAGISGGISDPLPMSFLTQKVSGSL